METPNPEASSRAPHFRLTIAPDGMQAQVSILQPPSKDEVDTLFLSVQLAFPDAGILRGVNEDVLRKAIQVAALTGQPVENVAIAYGQAPVDGADGRIAFHFFLNGKDPAVAAQERAAGHAEEKSVLKPLVRTGDVLAVIEAAQPGIDGYTVSGTVLPARVFREATVQAGDGVQMLDDGLTCAVAPDTVGYADFEAGTLRVESPFRISSDQMEVRMSVQPPNKSGTMLDAAEVDRWFEKNGVVHGFCRETIAAALQQARELGAPVHEVVIAKGAIPVAGTDARIEYHFTQGLQSGSFDGDGENFDYHERGFFQQVQKGDVLARKIPATPGEAGTDVRGNAIPALPGKDVALEITGEAVASEDGLECRAGIDGVVVATGSGGVGVFQEYTVPGDVDFHTGNLDMKGVLIIKGWVREGFKVRATGDIVVGGGVEASAVATEANLTVTRGILGNEEARVNARGHLVAQFIENARIWTGGDIAVRDGILNSQVTAEGQITATSGKGHIIGGVVRAAGGIEVNELGSKLGVRTVVDIGLDSATRAHLTEMERDCALYDRNEQKISKTLGSALQKKSAGRLPAAHNQALARLAHFHRDVELKRRKIENLKKKLEQMTSVTIKVRKAVYEGVAISLLGRRTEVREDLLQAGEFIWNAEEGRITYRI